MKLADCMYTIDGRLLICTARNTISLASCFTSVSGWDLGNIYFHKVAYRKIAFLMLAKHS